MGEVTYTASRLADGNKLFPPKVTILDNGIRVKIPGFLGGEECFLYYKQIGFVKAKTPLVGYSTLTIATDTGYVTVHGFSKKDVEAIKQAIEDGKEGRIQYVQVGNQNLAEPQDDVCDGPTVEIEEGVTSLDSDTLDDYDEIGRLVLPSTLEEIDYDAFEDHDELCDIDFSKVTKLRKIPDELFSDLKNVRSLVIPEGVEVFGEGGAVVYNCNRLTKIVLPSSLLKIKGSISRDCKSLEEVDMSRVQHVTKLPEDLFWGSQKIRKFIVPQGVTKVSSLFEDGKSVLEEIYLPASVEKVGYINGNCDNEIDAYLYADNAELKSGFFQDVRTLYVPEQALPHYAALAKGKDAKVRAMPAEKLYVYDPQQAAPANVAPQAVPPVAPPVAPPPAPSAPPQPYAGAQCPPMAPPDAAPAQRVRKRPGQLFSDELEELINMAVATGDVSGNKRNIIMHRAISEGEDPDVVEMVIQSRLYKQRNK